MLLKIKENFIKKAKIKFTMVTRENTFELPKMSDMLYAISTLGNDPDDFITLIPKGHLHYCDYMNVTHPIVGTGEEDKYLIELCFKLSSDGGVKQQTIYLEQAIDKQEDVISVMKKFFLNGKLPNIKTWSNVTSKVERSHFCDLIDARRFSSNHREQLLNDKVCGCFYCEHIFSPNEIKDWIDDDPGGTAVCPYCGIDAVIGESSGYPITKEFLSKMNKYWF